MVSAVDLFCGAGGLTCGLERSGIAVKLGIDVDPACAYPYATNNNANFLLKAVEDVEASELLTAYDGAALKLLAGCAPCQTFSTYNQKADKTDERWWLLLQFLRLIKQTAPELVTMENVPGLMRQNIFKAFVTSLKERNYHVDYKVVNCAEYGLPQRRNRLVLLASKLGPVQLLSPKEFKRERKTVREAIGNLPAIDAGAIDPQDPLHQSARLSKVNQQRIRFSKEGGTWRDWPKELVAACHKKQSGKGYSAVYGRMSWDEAAPTITTQFYGFGNGRFGHPEQDRAISLREGAILQSFPQNYQFSPVTEHVSKTVVGRLIGNAVPVLIAELIGQSILRHVEESKEGRR